jgi:hypothetical protein
MCSSSFALNGRLNRTIRDRVCETQTRNTQRTQTKKLNQRNRKKVIGKGMGKPGPPEWIS